MKSAWRGGGCERLGGGYERLGGGGEWSGGERGRGETPTNTDTSTVDAAETVLEHWDVESTDESTSNPTSRAGTLVDDSKAKYYGFCFLSWVINPPIEGPSRQAINEYPAR